MRGSSLKGSDEIADITHRNPSGNYSSLQNALGARSSWRYANFRQFQKGQNTHSMRNEGHRAICEKNRFFCFMDDPVDLVLCMVKRSNGT